MPEVNDRIIVKFLPGLIVKIREIISEFKGLVRTTRMSDVDSLVELTIWLNRPDSLDEGVINQYESRVYEFVNRLSAIDVDLVDSYTSVEYHITKFAAQSP